MGYDDKIKALASFFQQRAKIYSVSQRGRLYVRCYIYAVEADYSELSKFAETLGGNIQQVGEGYYQLQISNRRDLHRMLALLKPHITNQHLLTKIEIALEWINANKDSKADFAKLLRKDSLPAVQQPPTTSQKSS